MNRTNVFDLLHIATSLIVFRNPPRKERFFHHTGDLSSPGGQPGIHGHSNCKHPDHASPYSKRLAEQAGFSDAALEFVLDVVIPLWDRLSDTHGDTIIDRLANAFGPRSQWRK